MNISKGFVLAGLMILPGIGFSQTIKAGSNNTTLDGRQNTITTAVPFLMITPDSRSGAMGDAGVATPNDMNAIHWNAAKLAFQEKDGAISISYTPWLKALVPDVSVSYLSVFKRINNKSTFGGSLRYFALGEIQFTDINANNIGNYNPNELAVDGAYARKLSEHFGLGIAVRYIYSNLTGGTNAAGTIKAGQSVAGDITAYYQDNTRYKGYKINYSFGAAVTNIGTKVNYTNNPASANFIPANLRVGGYGQVEIDKFNTIALTIDFNKLLVPTPPIYYKQAANPNKDSVDSDGNKVIQYGESNDVPPVQGIFQSFSDAPGGWKEELKEINISTGIEYWYDKQFALRAGYFHEPSTKGNRQYITMGAGIRYNVFNLDFAYLFSFQQRNPLDNTLRFTLGFDFDAFKKQNEGDNQSNPGGIFAPPAN